MSNNTTSNEIESPQDKCYALQIILTLTPNFGYNGNNEWVSVNGAVIISNHEQMDKLLSASMDYFTEDQLKPMVLNKDLGKKKIYQRIYKMLCKM